jgi:hypothetical protein
MNTFSTFFKKLDFLGNQYFLEENDEIRNKSPQGAILSFMIIISSVVLACFFGKEMFVRKLPIVSISEEYLPSSIIYFRDMPFLFSFHKHDGEFILNPEMYFSFTITTLDIDNEFKTTLNDKRKFVTCDPMKFTTHREFVTSKINLPNALHLCLEHDDNFFMLNAYTAINSTHATVMFKQCNRTISTCADDMEEMTSDVYIKVTYMDTYFDSSNYTNPIQYYEQSQTQQISHMLLKRTFLRFTNNIYLSDNGWLLENVIEYPYITLNSIKFDVNPLVSKNTEGNMWWITFESPNLRVNSKRSYMKIQELIAKVGGLVKGLTLIIQIISYDYFRYKYLLDIGQLSIKTTLEDCEDLMNISSKKEEKLHKDITKEVKDVDVRHKSNKLGMNIEMSEKIKEDLSKVIQENNINKRMLVNNFTNKDLIQPSKDNNGKHFILKYE